MKSKRKPKRLSSLAKAKAEIVDLRTSLHQQQLRTESLRDEYRALRDALSTVGKALLGPHLEDLMGDISHEIDSVRRGF